MRKLLSAALGSIFAVSLSAQEVAVCILANTPAKPQYSLACEGDKLNGNIKFKDIFAKGWTLVSVDFRFPDNRDSNAYYHYIFVK
ncbi:MAG: hypothetical protein LBI57_07125 [Helicobacteraceae bacterium]|jgi:hypothetical protein|nr:hypothetical protein [Helicobacteraceae bacterium]